MVDAWMAFGKAYLLTQAKQLGRRLAERWWWVLVRKR